MPLQVPLQMASVPGQGARGPTGSPVTGEHVPWRVTRLHASHWPLHAALQQTPSTQNVEAHWPPEVHASPIGSLSLQWWVASQKVPWAQSAPVVHETPHTVPLQT